MTTNTDLRKENTPANRVLFITYGFPPNMEMGAQSCAQIARYLPMHGWEPIVLTIKEEHIEDEYLESSKVESFDENFKGTVIRTRVLPHIFDLYRFAKSLKSSVKSRGTNSTAAAEVSSQNPAVTVDSKSGVRNYILSLLSIPDMYTGWLFPGVLAGLQAIRNKDVKVIFSSSPFFTGHLIGYALAGLTRLPWVIHFRDPTIVGSQTKLNMPSRLRLALEKLVIRRADRVVCVTKEHADQLRRTNPQARSDKFLAVPNGFDAEEWEEVDRQYKQSSQNGNSAESKFVVLYAGQLYVQRSPAPVFEALRSLFGSGEIRRDRVRVDLVGWCETSNGRSVSDLIAEMELQDCVDLVGPKSREETLLRMKKSNLLLLLAEGWTVQIPGKTYEYLKAGRPILALTSHGSLDSFIRETGCGWSIDPSDHIAIKEAVRESYREWMAGRVSHVSNPETVSKFDRRKTTGQISAVFDQLVRATPTQEAHN